MPFVQLNNLVHRFADEGAREKPAIVFANSLGSDLRIWDEVAARLAGDFRVVRYDLRGHGLTEAAKPPYSADDLARDLVGLLDALEIRQAIVCGISVGGMIAQAAALNHSERVRALVLCDTGARIGSVDSWQQRIDNVRSSGVESLVQMTMERWFSVGFRERRAADVRGYSIMLRQTSADGYVGTCAALRDTDFRQATLRIKQPTLVLCGAEDIATPPELGGELAGSIPGAQFSLIHNAAHLPCIEQPEAVAGRMMQFFREVQIV
jgi:3-oxoadipate enol-lactonase